MIDFPASPSIGDTYTSGGSTWKWDGTKWVSIGSQIVIMVGDTPPSSPSAGTLWWDSVGGQLYVYYNDGNSSQWVIAVNYGFGLFLPLTGGTLTGPLTLAADPTAALGAATKEYVDARMPGSNRIINGDMRIDQRNGGASGTATGYTVDRWQFGGGLAGKGTWQRQTPGAPDFPYCLSFVSNSAYTPVTTDALVFQQALEADVISDFQWGTANAKSVTLSFWFLSSVSGTYSGAIRNYAGTRSYPFNFSFSTANGWTKVIIIIPGDTAGTWVSSGNAGSLWLSFDLGTGPNLRSPANAWAASNSIAATGSLPIVSINGGGYYITGVKLEVGSIATAFTRKSLTEAFADCQRYYQVGQLYLYLVGATFAAGQITACSSLMPVAMRATATMTITVNNNVNINSPTIVNGGGMFYLSGTVTAAGGVGLNCNFSANAEL